jgi:hypothetical protein
MDLKSENGDRRSRKGPQTGQRDGRVARPAWSKMPRNRHSRTSTRLPSDIRRTCRVPLILASLIAAALAALGVGWWAITGGDRSIAVALDNWADQQRAMGAPSNIRRRSLGFPYAIAPRRRPRIAAGRRLRLAGPTLHASASPFDPLTIEMQAPGEHRLIRVVGMPTPSCSSKRRRRQRARSRAGTPGTQLSGLSARDSRGQTVTLDAFALSLQP